MYTYVKWQFPARILRFSENWKYKNKNYDLIKIAVAFTKRYYCKEVSQSNFFNFFFLQNIIKYSNLAINFGPKVSNFFFPASLGVLSNPVGALLSGVLMDMCGRKTTICYTTLPFLFGWTLIGLSDDMFTLCLGRCISGLAIGKKLYSNFQFKAHLSTVFSRYSNIKPLWKSFIQELCLRSFTPLALLAFISRITPSTRILCIRIVESSWKKCCCNNILGEKLHWL